MSVCLARIEKKSAAMPGGCPPLFLLFGLKAEGGLLTGFQGRSERAQQEGLCANWHVS